MQLFWITSSSQIHKIFWIVQDRTGQVLTCMPPDTVQLVIFTPVLFPLAYTAIPVLFTVLLEKDESVSTTSAPAPLLPVE